MIYVNCSCAESLPVQHGRMNCACYGPLAAHGMPVYYTSSLGNRIHRISFRNCGLCEFRPHSTACADCRELKTPANLNQFSKLIRLYHFLKATQRIISIDDRSTSLSQSDDYTRCLIRTSMHSRQLGYYILLSTSSYKYSYLGAFLQAGHQISPSQPISTKPTSSSKALGHAY